jgi:SOUL heme-binding protein
MTFAISTFIGTLFGFINSETPPYKVRQATKSYEIRDYQPFKAASTDFTTESISYAKLLAYFSTQQTRIPLSLPIITTREKMLFVIPSVQTDLVPGGDIKVTEYQNLLLAARPLKWTTTKTIRLLKQDLIRDGIEYYADKDPLILKYYHPWSVFWGFQKIEVAVELVPMAKTFKPLQAT